jgi:hypothetical protein
MGTFVAAPTGEYCIAAHILTPPGYLTNDPRLPRTGSSVVVYHDCFRPSFEAPPCNPAVWKSARELLASEGGKEVRLRDGGSYGYYVVFKATDRDLWETSDLVQSVTKLPTRALHFPSRSLHEFREGKARIAKELYTTKGNIRRTQDYQRQLEEHVELLLESVDDDSLVAACATWHHIRTYFAVGQETRDGIEAAFQNDQRELVRTFAQRIL